MHLVLRFIDGRGKSVALFGNHVHDDGPVIIAGISQGMYQAIDIVASDGADVLHAQFREHFGRQDGGLDALFHGVQGIKGTLAYPSHLLQAALALFHELVITVLGTDTAKVFGNATDSGRIATAVVIDHDDRIAALVLRDIV